MIRKLIKQGHNTLTITLPTKWINKFNLSQGSEVLLTERENGLFLTADKTDKPSKITIDIIDLSIPLIWKYITTAYRSGYDEIIVKFSQDSLYDSPYKYFAHYIVDSNFATKEKLSPHEFINLLSERLIGFEVINHGKDFCILKEIGQSTSKEFDVSLRRIFLLLLDISEGIIKDLEKGNNKFLERVHSLDIQIDKFHDFCTRVLNKTGFEEPCKSSLISLLIYLLELVGDEFKHLAIQLKRKDQKKINSKKIISYLNSINQQFKIFYEIYYKYNKQKLIELFNLNKEFLDKSDDVKNNYKEDVQITIETINRYLDVIAEVLINKQVLCEQVL